MVSYPASMWVNEPTLVPCIDLIGDSARYDSLVLVGPKPTTMNSEPFDLMLVKMSKVDEALKNEGCIMPCDEAPGRRLIYAPMGAIDLEYDDVRKVHEAAKKGIKRAIDAGSRAPLLRIDGGNFFTHDILVGMLGALEATYEPLQYREDLKRKQGPLMTLGYWGKDEEITNRLVRTAQNLSSGLMVARDIGGGDPERMAPPKVAAYVKELFHDSCIKVDVIDNEKELKQGFPLFAAVNRAASVIERHRGCLIFLTYDGDKMGDDKRNIYLIGKGVTYDTGGADIKAGGIMAGMSRDKCGAAAVAGFFQVLRLMRPKNIRFVGVMCMARNSVGENCYVSDEVITSRAGLRIRIGNTDAEGRMVMADPLCWAKEDAMKHKNAHLITIATLTGHACLALGPYTGIIDNYPAKKEGFAQKVQRAGEALGDMMDISSLRREDFKFSRSTGVGEDLLQCNNAASSRTPRGHQFPAAFLMEAAGIAKYGDMVRTPLKYTHMDIAGAAGEVPDTPSGVPILALAKYFFGEQYNL